MSKFVLLAGAACIVLASLDSTIVWSDQKPIPPSLQGSSQLVTGLGITPVGPSWLIIKCKDGEVRVSMDDGHVEYSGNCQPDEAAVDFWNAIHRNYQK